MNTTSETSLLTDLSQSEASTIQGGSWRCRRVTPVYYYVVPCPTVSTGSSSGVVQNVNITIDD